MRRLRSGTFCVVTTLLLASGSSHGQEKVTLLPLVHPEMTAEYKHDYSVLYKSDSAEQIVPGRSTRGWVQLDVKGSWKSKETSKAIDDTDDFLLNATIDKAFNTFFFDQKMKTYDQHPYTLDQLDDRGFSWTVSSKGEVSEVVHHFKRNELNRPDIVTTFEQTWAPEIHLVLPETPVGQGDTWTGKQTFTAPFDQVPEKALIELSSTYEVKKLGKSKGNATIVIKEKRKVKCRTWAFVTPVSVIYEGEGVGEVEWKIDVDRRVVLSQKSKMTIQRPQVTVASNEKPADNIKAEVTLRYNRKLKKLK
jgi:hypothetical protein